MNPGAKASGFIILGNNIAVDPCFIFCVNLSS